MNIKIYNTLTGQKEIFKPIKNGEVKFYQCGPTVYWTQHIGNLRAMVMADLINRTFQYLGYKVNFVRNYTDVGHLTSDADQGEDKIENSAKKEKLTPQEIANKYIKIFEQDTADLNILESDFKPRATENIDEILEMIKILIDKNYAYQTGLAIYFDVSKAKDYNRLSGQILEEQKTETKDSDKKHPADFALWFFTTGKHKNALQHWSSPWGEGFPGWHIECSAIVRKFLGKTIDIHMGGIEHIPIHHTNEIAQSEAVNDAPLSNFWLHNEHLLVDNKKMAKSEGTGYSLAEIKEKGFSPLSLRYFFLQAHYRSKQNFTWEALEAAEAGLKHLYNQVRELTPSQPSPYQGEGAERSEAGGVKEKFTKAISDDFNIPKALAVAQELLKKDRPRDGSRGRSLGNAEKLATILDFDKVLGLKLSDAFKQKEIPEEIMKLAEERLKMRQENKWSEADQLRQKIENLGFEIEDEEEGYKIKKK